MPRPEKVQAVADIKERFERCNAVFLAEYAGLSVSQQQMLRRSLRGSGAEFKVVKMTLARRATADLGVGLLDEVLIGPTGIAFAEGDPVGAAKVLRDFAREHEVFVVKGGLLDGNFLSPERVSELADIETREVLLAKLAGLFNAAMANMVGALNALPREMMGLVDALIEKRRDAGEPDSEADPARPAEEPAAEDADVAAAADVADTNPAVEADEEASTEQTSTQTDRAVTGDDVDGEAAEEDTSEPADHPAEEE